MASEVGICNRALQKLGANSITSLTEDSRNGRACNASYEAVRDRLLRSHPWSFAITRVALAADSTSPAFGRSNAFQLPSDCLRLLTPYPEDLTNSHDWQVEGRKIYTDDSAPLNIRYVKQVTDPNQMDACFRESLAAEIAYELCEPLTQSNTKKNLLKGDKKDAIREAKRTNAIENVAAKPPEDTWVSSRL